MPDGELQGFSGFQHLPMLKFQCQATATVRARCSETTILRRPRIPKSRVTPVSMRALSFVR